MERTLPAVRGISITIPTAAIFLTLLVLAFARYPLVLLRPEFWADDAWLYTDALRGTSILAPYAGYLLVGTRSVAWLAAMASPLVAPLVSNLAAVLLLVGVATFATSERMPWDRFTGALIGAGIVLLSMSFQILGTMSHIQWPALLFMALTALAREPDSQLGKGLERVGLFLGGLTGPAAILTLPLFRGRRLAVVAAAAVVQVAVLLLANERSTNVDPSLVAEVLLVRAFAVPLMGPLVTLAGAAVIAISVAVLLRDSPLRLQLGYLILVPAFAGILAIESPTMVLLDGMTAPRYFWIAGTGLVILLATQRHRLLAWPLIALFAFGALTQFALPAPAGHWSEQAHCIGVTPCRIVVQPGEPYAVEWP